MVVRFREECLRVLVTPELDRLRNLRQTADRERFVLGRGLVRLLLGGWLDRSAREVLLESLSVQMGRNLMLAIPAT
jgi:phosphopantetheinyl transferase